MNFLSRLYPGDDFCAVALSAFVQVAVISALALMACRIAARRNAALRHCILLSALLWIPFSPLAALRLRHAGWFTFPAPPPSHATLVLSHEVTNEPANTILPESTAPKSEAPALPPPTAIRNDVSQFPPPSDAFRACVAVLLIACSAGAAILLSRLVRALISVKRLARTTRPADPLVTGLLADVCRDLRIQRRLRVLVSDYVAGPVTIGILNPAIVLPADLLTEVSPSQLRSVLTHESVHAVRGDYAIGIVQRLIGAFLWFHPLVHLLNRELCRAREEVCDNAAIAAAGAPGYARTLLALGQRFTSRSIPKLVPGFFGVWPLERRIAGILNQRRVVMTRVPARNRIVISSLVIFVGLALSALTPSRAQTTSDDRPDAPATQAKAPSDQSAGAPATATSETQQPAATWLDHGANFVSPDEEMVRAKTQQAQIAVSRAQLAVQEAQIKLEKERLDFTRKQKLLSNNSISVGEVEEQRLMAQLAEIQVARAKVDLEEANAAAVPARMIGLAVHDGARTESDRYAEHNTVNLRTFLARHFKQALDGGWDVTLLRRGNGQTRVIFSGVRDLSDERPSIRNENLQAGDQIIVRRDIVRVVKGPGTDSQVLWHTNLRGRTMTLPEVLKEAGVDFAKDANEKVLLTGTRAAGQKSWTASLRSIDSGFGADERVEPSDTIVLNWR